MSGPSDYFLIIGAAAVLIGTLLLWRMSVEVNAVLPGRVSLGVRKDWSVVKRVHRECFPISGVRIASNVTAAVGVGAFIIAIILRTMSK
jgi:hypothetical protein